jgi:CRISPR-associated protein Cmr2
LADVLVVEIEALYPRETGTATISCVKLYVAFTEGMGGYQPGYAEKDLLLLLADLGPDNANRVVAYYGASGTETLSEEHLRELLFEKKSFGELVSLAGMRLRRRKENKTSVPYFAALPHARRCQSCQTRPADEYDADEDGQPGPLCPVCRGKRDASGKRTWSKRFEMTLRRDLAPLAEQYFSNYDQERIHSARDLTQIGAACQGQKRGYIGFIYADGDSVGRYVETRRTMREYRQASLRINQATWLAVVTALATHLSATEVLRPESEGAELIHPFEIITVGGDDVLLIVPAHAALPIAIKLSEEFERRAPRVGDQTLRMSVGVVIADDHNPVRLLRDLTEELLKHSAKPYGREMAQAAIDFHILRSQAMLGGSASQARERFPYSVEADREKLRLTGRPYTRPHMAAMWDALSALKQANFPNSQMHALAENLPAGRGPSTLFYLYQSVRLKETGFEKLHQTLQAAKGRADDAQPLPWFDSPSPDLDFETPLWDVADLYDFC